MPSLSGGEVRVSFLVVIFGVRCFDLCKDSTVTTASSERWSSGARARRLSGCHRKGQAGCGIRATMVVRWSMCLDVIFIMFEVLCTPGKTL